MIVYFSGTGNTAMAATLLAEKLGDGQLLPLDTDMLLHPDRHTLAPANGRLVWAFPVYSWGIPPAMVNFMRNVGLSTEALQASHYMLVTCGDDIGYTDRLWRREMQQRGLKAEAAFAVEMPNTYVCMKGFDVDSAELERKKLEAAPSAVARIADAILYNGGDIPIRLSFSLVKTYIIYPSFVRFGTSPRPFHSTDQCVGCGRCAASCPLRNITMSDGRPAWADNCTLCLRCYHSCPVHAVAYGKQTARKGQYTAALSCLPISHPTK